MPRDFQHCGILTSVDSDEPVQPPFKLRNLKYPRSRYCMVLTQHARIQKKVLSEGSKFDNGFFFFFFSLMRG